MKKHDSKAWLRGYACAVATLIKMYGESTEVREPKRAGGLTEAECLRCNVDEYDMEALFPKKDGERAYPDHINNNAVPTETI